MHFIDTHAHIYLPEFEEDREQVVAQARDTGIETILLPAIDSSTHEAMLQTESRFKACKAMMGLHPCSVTNSFEKEIAVIKQYLLQRKFVAIGEIGLDFYWDKTFVNEQYTAFRQQVEIALEHQLPIVIHSRNATNECIGVIKEYAGITGVFHCFSGTLEQAQAIMDAGFMLGIGGVVTFKNAGLDKIITQTGIEQVILETDAPYLAPVPYRGKRNEPAYTKLVAEKISSITGIDLEKVMELTTRNANNLFKLS